jgi:hypothetical protein
MAKLGQNLSHHDDGSVEDAIRSTRVALILNAPREEIIAAIEARGFNSTMSSLIMAAAHLLVKGTEGT